MSDSNHELMMIHIEMVVPLMTYEISQRGGIQEWQLEQVSEYADLLGGQGDALQYYVKGQSGKMMNILCECLAILSFMPGGVKFSGLHFESTPTFEAPTPEPEEAVV